MQADYIQRMLPSWLSRIKDGRMMSNRKVAWNRKHSENPAVLARILSLKRANARAKSVRSDALGETRSSAHRCSKSIDALYVLSNLKDGVQPIDLFASEDCESKTSRADTDINKVTLSLIQDRINRGQDLWDREFSSMSSYASDHDGVSGRERGPQRGAASGSKPGQEVEGKDLLMECESSENEMDDFAVVLDTDSLRSVGDSSDSGVSCKCGCEDELEGGADETSCELDMSSLKGDGPVSKNRARRCYSRSRLSALLPPDLHGMVGDSVALVKHTRNPYEDFRSSMYDMIMEKDLEESGDMEELLYCYLSLNAPEHHDLIKEAFSDVWSDILMRVR